MKLLLENWRKFVNEGVFYVDAAQLLPSEELGHGKNDPGYDLEQAVEEKVQQIQQNKLEPIEACHQKPVNTYRLADKPMEKSGQAEPFYYVLNGHHRLEAINRLGIQKVPIYLTQAELAEEGDFQKNMKKQLPAELDFLLKKGDNNTKVGPGIKNPKNPKFKSKPPGAEGAED